MILRVTIAIVVSTILSHGAVLTCDGDADLDGQSCSCVQESGVTSGSFNDAVDGGNYRNNQLCWWLISASNADTIQLSFSEFNIKPDDLIKVYRCADAQCSSPSPEHPDYNLTGDGNNNGIMGTTYSSASGYMKIVFETNEEGRKAGFVALWNVEQSMSHAWTSGQPCEPGCAICKA